MNQPAQTGQILQHLETLTRYRDTSLLKISLMNTMLSLTRLREVRLYDVLENETRFMIALSAWSEEGEVRGSNDMPVDELMHEVDAGSPIGVALGSQQPVTTHQDDHFLTCIPIVLGDKPFALFEFRSAHPLTASEQDVLDGIIGVFRNYLDLLRDSQHDTLTGLLNRRTFDQGFAALLSGSPANPPDDQRHACQQNWLAVMDIDHFKRINDKFGHLYGDEVLILMANLMRRSFRRHDRLYRFGGEEFVVLLRNVDADGAMRKLEQFRQLVEHHDFPQVGRVTISIGLAAVTQIDGPAGVIGKADEALYYAKEHGRNQICHYEALIGSGALTPTVENQDVEFF